MSNFFVNNVVYVSRYLSNCKVALENVLERVPGLACLDVMEGVVCGEQDERLKGEKHPGIVSQQLGKKCRARAPGG